MSRALEHLGRFAARRPWIVIGSWVAIGFLVITSAAAFGRDLEDPFEAPGLDSHRATELLAQAGSTEAGLGADVVLTPRDLGTTDPAAALQAGRQAAVESGVVSPDGEVALIRIQYPERQHLEPDDLANVQGAHEAPGRAELFDGWYPRIDAPPSRAAPSSTPLGTARSSSSRTTSWTTSPTWSCPARPSSRGHDVAWRRERRPQP